MPAEDDGSPSNAALRSALEFAVSAAASQADSLPEGVAALRRFRRTAVLNRSQLATVRRIVESDDELRRKLGERAPAAVVDEVGRNWLTAEAVTVQAPARGGRRRGPQQHTSSPNGARGANARPAELAALRALRGELTDAVAQLAELRRQLDAALAAVETGEQATAAARHDAQHWRRRADELAHALTEAASSRDRVLAELAWHSGDAGRFADQPEVRSVRQLAARRRAPIPVPGGLRRDAPAAVEHVLRAHGAIVLVDGYNVAKLGWPDLTLEQQRAAFIDALEALSRRLGVVFSVIFDGADVAAPAARRTLVAVWFSEPGTSADDEIRQRVGALPAHRPVVVVTDDREVVSDVARLGATTVPSAALLALRR
jgi:hypothetical protein